MIEIGDIVKVVDDDYTYSSYRTWINDNYTSYLAQWTSNNQPSESTTHLVVGKGVHPIEGIVLYLIQAIDGRVYIISKSGLELMQGAIASGDTQEDDVKEKPDVMGITRRFCG